MEYRGFGLSGMQVSRLCLGAMTFGGDLPRQDVPRVIDEAIAHGVNLIDTADSYGNSEEILGQVLSPEQRERVFLVSKVYRRYSRDGRIARNSRTNITFNLERSLRLLQTDHLDLLLLHHPDPDTPVEQTLHTLDELVRQGKIRYWGVSNHYAWQMAYMLGLTRERHSEPMVAVQSCYSILERQIEQETVPMLQRFHIGLMCYSPLCGGILTGKYHPETGEPAEGRAARQKAFRERTQDEQITRIVHELRAIAREQEMSLAQLAIAWLLAKPWVSTVILGGSKPEHFSVAYETADRRLPDDVVQRIDDLSAPRVFGKFLNQPQAAGADLNVNA